MKLSVGIVTILSVLVPNAGCRQEVIELAPAMRDDHVSTEEPDALETDAESHDSFDTRSDDRIEPERAEKEEHRDGDNGNENDHEHTGVCEKACYLLEDCGFLDVPGSPFGGTLEACLQGAGSPGCDKLWDLDPGRARCVLDASTCEGLWLCLL